MDTIFYTVRSIFCVFADLMSVGGMEHCISMFLLREVSTVGSRMKLENFQWELV